MGDVGITDKVKNLACGRVTDGERLADCAVPLDEGTDITPEGAFKLDPNRANVSCQVDDSLAVVLERVRDVKHLASALHTQVSGDPRCVDDQHA